MKKFKISIGLLNGNEKVTFLGDNEGEVKMAFCVLSSQEVAESIEVELHDLDGRVIESAVVKAKTENTHS